VDETGPSWTARRVAAHRLDFTRVPAPYGDAAADEALAGDVAGDLRITEGRMHEYLAARTAFFDRIVVGALDGGMRQVVIGGAGYDGRALRYAKPGVRWFEVDHPATQADKRERLDRLGLAAPHVRFVAADFAKDPVADLLPAAGLDANAPALFLLEGVAVYLEPAVVDAILDQFRQVAGAGSRLAISVSLSGESDRGGRAGFQASVAAMGEPARSGFAADEAEGILARAGWLVTDGENPTAAARRQRLRSVGLLTAIAGPKRPPSTASQEPQKNQTPQQAPRGRQTPASPVPVPPSEDSLSLSALLSQALVAFTIESDNEAEHLMPHRTQNYGASAQGYGAWLVSMVMYENCLKFVGEEPMTVAELERLARTGTNLDGMRRWGYITIDGTSKKIHKTRPGPGAILRATPRGLQARQVWTPIAGLTEQRWRDRFGADQVARLKDALLAGGRPARPRPARLPPDPRSEPGQPRPGPRPPAEARPRRPADAAPVGPPVQGPALVRARLRARIGALPRGQRQPAPRPEPGGHKAPRPSRPDRHLEGSRELGDGRPGQSAPGGRRARPKGEPGKGRAPDP